MPVRRGVTAVGRVAREASLQLTNKHLKEVREQVMCVPGGRALHAGRPASPEALNTFLALP